MISLKEALKMVGVVAAVASIIAITVYNIKAFHEIQKEKQLLSIEWQKLEQLKAQIKLRNITYRNLTAVVYRIKYKYVYNISDIVNTTLIRIPDTRYLLLIYSSKYSKINSSKIYDLAKSYDIPIYLYDIDKPWVAILLYNSTNATKMLPLMPVFPVPSLICVVDGRVSALFANIDNTENLLMFFENCGFFNKTSSI